MALRIALIGLTAVCSVHAAEIYVAPSGDDGNPGTKAKPFATLQAARDAIRKLPGAAKANGVTVWIQEGTYALDKSFHLEAKDSGAEKAPITYRAGKDGKVIFTGGVRLSAHDWTPVTNPATLRRLPKEAHGNVMRVDLKRYGLTTFDPLPVTGMASGALYHFKIAPEAPAGYELFCNDQALQLARWPNTGYVKTGKIVHPGAAPRFWDDDIGKGARNYVPPEKRNPKDVPIIAYRDPRHANWADAEDPWIFIWNNFFADIAVPVREVDRATGTFTLEYPLGYGLAESYDRTDKKYYFFNLLEELDRPGEYYLDRETGSLYCWPPVPVKDAHFVLTLATQPVFVLKDVSHVTLRGITIDGGRAEEAIRITGGRDVHILAFTIKNLAGMAVRVDGGVGHSVQNCHIFNTGTGAITMMGGERRTLTPAGHLADNNHIHDFSRVQKSYSPAITLQGVGNVARHNKLHGSEHAAMHWKGNDHLIEYNEIFDVVRTGTDMGAIYTGRDITCLGVVIRHNYFHHIGNNNEGHGTQAIFLDDGTSGHHIYGNVFFKAGSNASVKYHGGTRNILENNICIGSPPAALLHIQGWGGNFPNRLRGSKTIMDRLREIDPTRPPWSERWPWLATVTKTPPVSNKTFNNVVVNTRLNSGHDNFLTSEDPGFADMKNEDFTLKKDSIVFTKLPNFKPVPFKKMGLRLDEYCE